MGRYMNKFITLFVIIILYFRLSSGIVEISKCGHKFEWPLSYCARYRLHWAATVADSEALISLLNKGWNVNLQDRNGWTALHYASERGRAHIVALLLASGADIQISDKFGRRPLERAQEMGCKTLTFGNYVKTCPLAPVDYTNTIQYLQAASCSEYWSPRSWCTKFPVHWAAIAGHTDLVKNLLGMCYNVNQVDDLWGRTTLHRAASTGRSEIVKNLLGMCYDVNQVDDLWGRTPLHRAAFTGRSEIVALLIQFGADTVLTDKYGETPYDTARSKYCDIDPRHRLCNISPWNYTKTLTYIKEGCNAINCTKPLKCYKNTCVINA